MPNGISKRQQLRNEKTLAELIRTIPGNDRCADCDALTPGTLPRCDTMLLTMTIPLSSSIELILSLAINQDGQAGTYDLPSPLQSNPLSPIPPTNLLPEPLDGHLPLHAVRRNPPQAGYTHIQGQVLVDGYMVVRAG
jgi:hypothetical protein